MILQVDRIEKLIEQGGEFTFENFSTKASISPYGGVDTADWISWKTRAEVGVRPFLPPGTALEKMLDDALGIRTQGNGHSHFDKQHALLMAVLESTLSLAGDNTFAELNKTVPVSNTPVASNRVFIVHGHDSQFKNELELFLRGIGLDPIVLHRQPDEGKTIIEKFEKYSDVGFAFILLTPDEIAYTMDQAHLPEQERTVESRARPNVIFEFGFFVGKLTRSRVCCLIKGSVARPSDVHGLIYKQVVTDIEGIGYTIIKELKAAGYTVAL